MVHAQVLDDHRCPVRVPWGHGHHPRVPCPRRLDERARRLGFLDEGHHCCAASHLLARPRSLPDLGVAAGERLAHRLVHPGVPRRHPLFKLELVDVVVPVRDKDLVVLGRPRETWNRGPLAQLHTDKRAEVINAELCCGLAPVAMPIKDTNNCVPHAREGYCFHEEAVLVPMLLPPVQVRRNLRGGEAHIDQAVDRAVRLSHRLSVVEHVLVNTPLSHARGGGEGVRPAHTAW
mmetsp:Transcript_52487/g.166923  ORF Transcript_52487/g.166923 Transcript_52487/m.166923 type:complete len:233 (-) Transcript_52487:188-886(-)